MEKKIPKEEFKNLSKVQSHGENMKIIQRMAVGSGGFMAEIIMFGKNCWELLESILQCLIHKASWGHMGARWAGDWSKPSMLH